MKAKVNALAQASKSVITLFSGLRSVRCFCSTTFAWNLPTVSNEHDERCKLKNRPCPHMCSKSARSQKIFEEPSTQQLIDNCIHGLIQQRWQLFSSPPPCKKIEEGMRDWRIKLLKCGRKGIECAQYIQSHTFTQLRSQALPSPVWLGVVIFSSFL